MTRTAYKIDLAGHLTSLDLDAGDSLKIMQTAVDGYIERVPLSDNLDMYVNEEGLNRNLPLNSVGTLLYTTRNPDTASFIYGNILLTGGISDDGETLGLDQATAADIRDLLKQLA